MPHPNMPRTALPRLNNLALVHTVQHSQTLIAALAAPVMTQQRHGMLSVALDEMTLALVHELALRVGEGH